MALPLDLVGKRTMIVGDGDDWGKDLQAALMHAFPGAESGLTVGRTVKVGALGPDAAIECDPADGGGTDFPVCAWATDTLVGVVVFSHQRPAAQIEAEFHRIRAALEASVA